MIFTIYKTDTGRICYSGWSALDTIPAPDESILVGAEYSRGWIADGLFNPLPEQPTPTSEFNFTTKVWEETHTLEKSKTDRNLYVNEERAKANQSYFIFSGKHIAADPLSRSDIDAVHGMVLMNNAFPSGWPGGWKAMDNSYVAISDVSAWSGFYTAMVNQGTVNFAHAQSLKGSIDAATTIAEVEAVVW